MSGGARSGLASDDGSGSILTVAIIGSVVALTMVVLPLYMGFAVRRSVAGAADASALAAADTAVGLLPGFPCDAASTVAAANGAMITACEVDGLIVTVTASRAVLGIAATAVATAGPAGPGVD